MEEKNRKEVLEKRKKPHHGRNVKWFRKQKGFSQEYMASLFNTNISQQQISDWEKEEVLSDELLEKIAQLLDIGVSWLKESIFDEDLNFFSQDGNNNNNFQKNDRIEFTIHNPLEAMERVYNSSTKKLTTAYNDSKAVLLETIDSQKKEIQRLSEQNDKLQNVLLDFVEKLKDKIS